MRQDQAPGCHCEEPLRDAAIWSTARAVADCRVAKQLLAMAGRGMAASIRTLCPGYRRRDFAAGAACGSVADNKPELSKTPI
jgi:hypothetical protein